ncbi:MAG TPA: response regulator [Stellaceae bacterium]|jgi:CheY-like chemotaxis protein|nr:response regulator [Stellaceae bacterium]
MPRILLVEDDTAVRLVFVEILFDAGYEVDAAPSFRAGAAILESAPSFALVITDGRFPDGNGWALADKAKARGIPALIVTGHGLDLDPQKYRVLAKPVRPAVFLAAVEAAMTDGR